MSSAVLALLDKQEPKVCLGRDKCLVLERGFSAMIGEPSSPPA
jgi:hypothetical protein